MTLATTSTKHTRSCIACGKQADKQSLLRIVRTKEGPVFDVQGKTAGRGAYVCGIECLEMCQKKNALARALKMDIPIEDYRHLLQEIGAFVACEIQESKE